MMLPARDLLEEDRSRTGPESAAAIPMEAPPAASGRGAGADSAAQPDSAVQADRAVQAHSAVQADSGMVASDSPPASALSPEAGSSAPDDSVDVAAGHEWHQVLTMFVDDPRGSVAEASAMVDEAINGFIAAARGRQASLAESWQAQDTDTEQLRMALRDYRMFWTSVTQLPQPT